MKTAVSRNKPNKGMIKPIMGISTSPAKSSAVADALFPKVRQRVLAVLFGRPDRSFYANEVIALAQSGSGAVQRELAGLSEHILCAWLCIPTPTAKCGIYFPTTS